MSRVSNIKLGDIGKISMCKRILKNQTSDKGDIPFYKISTFGGKADCFISKELYEEYKKKYPFPKEGAILISAAGTIGRTVIYNGEDAFFQDSNIVWVDNDESKVLNLFLYYYYQLKPWKKTTGSTIERLYNDNLRDIDIIFPTDINEQKRMTNVLKNIDSKIKNNNKIISELESIAKIIYYYWFLQFDFPNEEGKPYKSSGGKMIWNEELKKAIPEGWNVKKIGDVLSRIPNTYKYTSSEYKKDGKFPIIDQSNDYICGYTDKEEDLLKLNDCVVFGDHTKFVKYVNFNFARGADGTQILNSSDDKLPNHLLYMQISNMQLVSQGYSRYFKFLKDKYVIIPVKEISDMYINKIKIALKKIRKCREENKELSNLRDFLLPLLMNGQVKFND